MQTLTSPQCVEELSDEDKVSRSYNRLETGEYPGQVLAKSQIANKIGK